MPRRKSAPPTFPVLPVRDTVLYPQMVTSLFVGRPPSQKAVEHAEHAGLPLLVVAQRDQEKEEVEPPDLFDVGTTAAIGRTLKMPDGTLSVLLQGQERVRVVDWVSGGAFLQAVAAPLPDERVQEDLALLAQRVLELFEHCVRLSPHLGQEAYVAAMNAGEPGRLADIVAATLNLTLAERQSVLETTRPDARLGRVADLLDKELRVLDLQRQIQEQVAQELGRATREQVLREHLATIERELGSADPFQREMHELRERVATSDLPPAVAARAREELDRLATLPPAAPEVAIIRTYVDWLVDLPWCAVSEEVLDLPRAERVLDETHFGLEKVKERIIEYVAVRKMAGAQLRSPILCFVGAPGVGKTSLGQAIATALGRCFVRVSLGGIRDEAEIRGHRRTYVGALPGRVIQTMRQARVVNPVFMLDELDKLGLDFRGDPAAALLEVLDPEQNHAFSDPYLDLPYDLSHVLFIGTANTLDTVPPALADRLEVIELPGYTEEEKLEIARRFLLPRQIAEHGLPAGHLALTTPALRQLVRGYTREAGVRSLERELGGICRKLARQQVRRSGPARRLTERILARYLGPPRYRWGLPEAEDTVGVTTGVYWSESGGDLAPIEVQLLPGKGKLILTGKLGDVMKESATAALSYTRAQARELGIAPDFCDRLDVHIHCPAAAQPTDGPSAGIAMATALVSALTRRPVRRDVVMTGEITVRGRVLAIGGVKEKVLAAHRAGVRTVVLPKRNAKDLDDVPADARQALSFVLVERMDEALRAALCVAPAAG
ncbi:MAG: endopeptidase La [Chloroflexi bacterium]|nr:endopeptidase La [Chloroflexota bacterium]